MAKTLLDGVNDVLKRLDLLDADTGELSSLSDSPRQNWVDTIIQIWNEGLDELYSALDSPKPNSLTEATITLATGDRTYAMAADALIFLRRLHLFDQTNHHYITFPDNDGFERIQWQDPEEDDTGQPTFAAIDPQTGELVLDRTPGAAENGRVYRYFYYKDLSLSAATDTFPFTDAVYRALVPAVAQLWRRDNHKDFDASIYSASLARAARYMAQTPIRKSWSPSRRTDELAGTDRPFDP